MFGQLLSVPLKRQLSSANSDHWVPNPAAPGGALTNTHAHLETRDCAGAGHLALRRRANPTWNMALRPQRTFRRRQVESSDSDSDSDGAKEQSAEEPASAGGRTEGAERPRGARSARGRGRVWASSRRSPGAAPRGDGGAGDRGVERAPLLRSRGLYGRLHPHCSMPGLPEASHRSWWHFAVCILR
jgi:hypothetical protein